GLGAGLPEVPADAVTTLIAALGEQDPSIRIAAASALITAGTKAAPAVEALVRTINATYPKQQDPMKQYQVGAEVMYWRALASIGEPAVAPTSTLLSHSNQIVRMLAAMTLGEIGPPAKTAAEKLRGALKDQFGEVAIEAAGALCRLGDSKQDAIETMKRAMEAPNTTAGYAIDAIPRMGETGKELVPIAMSKLASPNPNARFAAA